MSRVRSFMARRAGGMGAVAAVVFYVVAGAYAQEAASERDAVRGRIDFGAADLPPATVEVDLSQGMFDSLFGIGDAAVAGVAETLLQSAREEDRGTKMAAEQLAAARQIMQLAGDVVREVRIRVYEDLPEERETLEAVAARFDAQLREGNWENVVRVREEDASVRISLLREGDAVRGIFVVAGENEDLVLANILCDVSPESIKKLTSAAAKIGLENGLQPMIEMKMRELNNRRSMPSRPEPPRPESGDNN